MKNTFCKSALLVIASALVGFSALAQMPMVPDPMQGIPTATPLARAQFYPDIPSVPLPPNVRDPVASIMPAVPVMGKPDLNPYNYAAANPINLSDPSGLSPGIATMYPEHSTPTNLSNCKNNETQVTQVIERCWLQGVRNIGDDTSCFYMCPGAVPRLIIIPLGGSCPGTINTGSFR